MGLIVGGAIWVRYWFTISVNLERDPLWHGYVLLTGVLGGLVTAVTGLALLIFSVLDWSFGDTSGSAVRHFDETPGAIAALGVGGAIWLYSRAVLRSQGSPARAETDRVYDYLASAVGLLASAGGLTTVVVAVVQTLIPGNIAGASSGETSTLIAAITLLIVGVPLWWRHWSSIQQHRSAAPQLELASPSRRIYLFALFGVGGVVALISLLTLVIRLLEDILDGQVGSETVYATRISFALVVTVGAVAAYHWAIHKEDRGDIVESDEPILKVRSIVLVSGDGADTASEITRLIGVRVRVWDCPDVEVSVQAEHVIEAIRHVDHPRALVIATDAGFEVLPFTERA